MDADKSFEKTVRCHPQDGTQLSYVFHLSNNQQLPIKHDTVCGPGHGIRAVYRPAGHWNGEDR